MLNVTQQIRTTCPRDCYDTCGIVVVTRDDKIAHVRGDPTHPVSRGKLCAKCSIGYNREWLDPKVRLTRPLRRIGPKGEGKFAPVSWETALTTIAERFTQVVATSGAQTILNAHYIGRSGALPGVDVLEHQSRGVESPTSAIAGGATARRPLHGRR